MMSVRSLLPLCAVLLACSAVAAETRRPEPKDIPVFELRPAGRLRREGSGWSFQETLALPRAWPRVTPARKGLYSLEVISENGSKQTVPAALETFSSTPPIRRFERELPPVSLDVSWRSAPITVTHDTRELVFRANGKVLKTLRRPAKPPRATRFTVERLTLRTGQPAALLDWEMEEGTEGLWFAVQYRVRGDTWETLRTSSWPDTDFDTGRRGVTVPSNIPTETSDVELRVLLWDGFHLTRYSVGYIMAATGRTPEWKQLVEGLDRLGFFSGLEPEVADEARRQAITDRGFHFVEPLYGRRTLRLDERDLLKGGALDTVERLREGLEERGVKLGKLKQVFDRETGEYSLTVNGRTYTLQSPEEHGQLTSLAPLARTMDLLDKLLAAAGSPERVYLRDYDGQGFFLTPEMVELFARSRALSTPLLSSAVVMHAFGYTRPPTGPPPQPPSGPGGPVPGDPPPFPRGVTAPPRMVIQVTPPGPPPRRPGVSSEEGPPAPPLGRVDKQLVKRMRRVPLAVGDFHGLAITPEGKVIAWGSLSQATRVPKGLSDVVAVAGGMTHSLALRADGTVVGWGNIELMAKVPEGLSGVIAIAAAGQHSLALKADGTVVGWGVISMPEGLGQITAIAAARLHDLLLKSDGTVVAFGNNTHGETSVPAGLKDVVAISAADGHSLALKADGTIVGWGHVLVPRGLSDVVAIAAGDGHDFALKADGTVVAWSQRGTWMNVPQGLSGIVSIWAAGDFSAMAVAKDGTVTAWGRDRTIIPHVPAGLTVK